MFIVKLLACCQVTSVETKYEDHTWLRHQVCRSTLICDVIKDKCTSVSVCVFCFVLEFEASLMWAEKHEAL